MQGRRKPHDRPLQRFILIVLFKRPIGENQQQQVNFGRSVSDASPQHCGKTIAIFITSEKPFVNSASHFNDASLRIMHLV